MEHIEKELFEVLELNRKTRTAEAETRLRRLLAKLPRHELLKGEHQVRQAIDQFLPKRKRALLGVLEAALASRPSPSPMRVPSPERPESKLPPQSRAPAGPATTASSAVPPTIQHLDALIPKMRSVVDNSERERLLRDLARSTLQLAGFDIQDYDDPLLKLFDAANTNPQKRVILACIARSLASISWLYEVPSFRLPAIKLFDEIWQHEIYGSLGIQSAMQTHDKWRRIEGAVAAFEAQLKGLMNGLTSLAVFPAVRQELKKALNSAIARATVWPLAPRDLVTLGLDEVFAAVAEYMEASESAAFEARTRALDALHDYSARAKDSTSQLVRDVLAGTVTRLMGHLDAHFADSPLSKPAVVTIRLAPKKYPLGAIGAECQIGVTVDCAGPGHAFDVELEYAVSDNLVASTSRQFLGNLQPGRLVEGIALRCRIERASSDATIEGKIRWTNHNQENVEQPFRFALQSQPTGIDWKALDTLDPYSLEPVTEERELVGRTEFLNQLTAKTTAKAVGSFFVFGQKRVGKTSLVRSLESRLKLGRLSDLLVVYLDGGDYVHPDAVETIQRLGTRLCEEIKQADKRFASVPIPTFEGALSPIDSFLRAVLQIAPEYRIVFILDEFDELPVQIYRRGPVGDAFFLTLRSISAKPPFGFVLVGGEKMEFILSTQGDALNKFQSLRVDYFDRDKHWPDFQDLIRRPTASWLEISDEALIALYEASAGNPFFAKLLCNELFRLVLQRRDAHVTPPEIRETVRRTLANAGSNRFAHFWEDGIFEETGDKVEERSMARRHVLLALADGLRRGGGGGVSRTQLIESARHEDLTEDEISFELLSFEHRQVLECLGSTYRCKVGLFGEWLRDRGVQEIVTTFSDRTTSLKRRAAEERDRISEADLQSLADSWGPYKGRTIGPEAIRGWLAQIGNVAEQRLMFKILQHVRFYTTAQIRAKMKEAHGIVERRMTERRIIQRVESGQRKRHDILVSHLGGVAKSGVRYGQLYADENNILSDSVVERDRLGRALGALDHINALVLVDDFIGSGHSAAEAFGQLTDADRELLRKPELVVVYVVVCGFEAGRAKLEAELDAMRLPIHVHLCDQLTEADRCFTDNSCVFPDDDTRRQARAIAFAHGRRLVKNAPLGYADCQSLVVFDTNCPNNSLPILWEERADWKPLFKRQ